MGVVEMEYKELEKRILKDAVKKHISLDNVKSSFKKLMKKNENNYGILFSIFKPIIYNDELVLATSYENNNCVDDLLNNRINNVVEGKKIEGVRTFSKKIYSNGNGDSIPHYACGNGIIEKMKELTNKYAEVSIEQIPGIKNFILGAYRDNPYKNSHNLEHCISREH